MKKVAFITSHFPFDGGEQFIENEIPFWKNNSDVSVVLFPVNCSGNKRKTPDGVHVDSSLSEKLTMYNYIFLFFCTVFSKVFIKEVIWLAKKNMLSFLTFKHTLANVYAIYKVKYKLKKKFKLYQIDRAYCYWNDVQAYASCLLKSEGVIQKVFTRCHGYDLYEDRNELGYIPIKRQFIHDFDLWFVISTSAKKYLENRFAIDPNKVIVSRLGVNIPESYASCTPKSTLSIVTLSYCVHIKRLDRIVDALKHFSSEYPGIAVHWSHIGGGELEISLKKYAFDKLKSTGVSVNFLGTLPNREVKNYFNTYNIDLFMNTSDSEGVPVSIMEAMSYGVPIIAPDVGGIAELINVDGCILLPKQASSEDISNAIYRSHKTCKQIKVRKNCKTKIYNEYNAVKNFTSFIKVIKNND